MAGRSTGAIPRPCAATWAKECRWSCDLERISNKTSMRRLRETAQPAYVRFNKAHPSRRDGRVAEGARLESVYTARYPGFESLSLRHNRINDLREVLAPRQILSVYP